MAKKTSYNSMAHEALVLELAKLRDLLNKDRAEKRKSGNAKSYRENRKNIARILTAMNAKSGQVVENQ